MQDLFDKKNKKYIHTYAQSPYKAPYWDYKRKMVVVCYMKPYLITK